MAQRNQCSKGAIDEYALCHLANVGKEASDVAEDLLEDRVCPGDKPYNTEKRRAILQKRLVGLLGYIAGGYRNLFVAAVIVRRAGKKKGG
jgi:hypothetical protein